MISYSEADFTGFLDSRKSTLGYVFMLASGAMSWRSVKQTLTATSTMEIEFVSCFGATLHGVWLESFIFGLRVIGFVERPLILYCDNLVAVFYLRMVKVKVEVNISTLNT